MAAEPSNKLTKLASSKSWIKFPFLTPEIVDSLLSEPDFTVNITRAGGQLFHHRRRMQDGQVIFFLKFQP